MNMAPSERGEGSVFGGSVHSGSVHGGSVYGGSVYGGSVYGGSVRGRPQSVYQGATGGSAASVRAESRTRSQSLAEPKNYNRDGRIILHYCKYPFMKRMKLQELTVDSTRYVFIHCSDPRGARLYEG